MKVFGNSYKVLLFSSMMENILNGWVSFVSNKSLSWKFDPNQIINQGDYSLFFHLDIYKKANGKISTLIDSNPTAVANFAGRDFFFGILVLLKNSIYS